MTLLVLAVDPTLAAWGQVAAIVIGLYALVFILVAVVFNVVAALGLDWLREKINIIKLLRPTVDSLNTTTKLAEQGAPPDANTNVVIRTIAEGPARLQTIEKKVDEGAEKVAHYVIEYRARAEQVKSIAKAFFVPATTQKQLKEPIVDTEGLEFKSPGYRKLMQAVPAAPSTDGPAQAVTASQLKNVPAR